VQNTHKPRFTESGEDRHNFTYFVLKKIVPSALAGTA